MTATFYATFNQRRVYQSNIHHSALMGYGWLCYRRLRKLMMALQYILLLLQQSSLIIIFADASNFKAIFLMIIYLTKIMMIKQFVHDYCSYIISIAVKAIQTC